MTKSTAACYSVADAKRSLDQIVTRVEAGEVIRLTRRGRIVAEIVPKVSSRLGCMAGTIEILGDVVEPTGEEWEATR